MSVDSHSDAFGSDVSHTGQTAQLSAMATIQEALSGLRYGHVTIIVHNGVVVQVERLEKKRLRSD